MRRVVIGNPAWTIGADEVTDDMIVVAKLSSGRYGGYLEKLHRVGDRYYWVSLHDGYCFWNYAGYGSRQGAILGVFNAGEVFVLSDLSELADWIKENAGV